MKIEEYRKQIARIDEEILRLFLERMEVSGKIGSYKKERGLPVRVPEVEEQKIRRMVEESPEELKAYIPRLFSTLFELSRSYQDALSGPAGDFQGDLEKTLFQDLLLHAGDPFSGESADAWSFIRLIHHAGIRVAGKKVLVLGSGNAASAVLEALQELGAGAIVVASRKPESLAIVSFPKGDAQVLPAAYEHLSSHADVDIIVNTTPVGMYPRNGESPISLSLFPDLSGVLDLISNPYRTALLMEAEERKIPCENGLYLLVVQAVRRMHSDAAEEVEEELAGRIWQSLSGNLQNIALIGMPGAGKSQEARRISEATGRAFYDSDEEVTKRTGMTPEEWITTQGEETFRKLETEVLRDIAKVSHAVIATGGGVVTRPENYALLHQNSRIIWLKKDIGQLALEGRPISKRIAPEELYKMRKPLYEAFADEEIELDS